MEVHTGSHLVARFRHRHKGRHVQIVGQYRGFRRSFRLDANVGVLTHIVSVSRAAGTDAVVVGGIQGAEQEVTVIHTLPSPVHVEVAVAVITVNDELMASCRRLSTVDDRSSADHFRIDDAVPLIGRIIISLDVFHRVAVAEIVSQRRCYSFGGCSRTVVGVVHQYACSAELHQGGYGIVLSCGGVIAVAVYDVVPVYACDRDGIHLDLGTGRRERRNLLNGLCRVAVVVHHLCHRRCHATCHTRRIVEFRTFVVVWCVLSPKRTYHWGYRSSQFAGCRWCGSCHAHLICIALQPGLHVLGNVTYVKGALVGITQHSGRTVVAAGNHVAL